MSYARIIRINFFDSRRKGSIPYVPRQRPAPGVPPAARGRPARVLRWSPVWSAFFCVVHRLIGRRESDCAPRALCADAASLQNLVETQSFKVRLIEGDSAGIATPDQRTARSEPNNKAQK